MRVAQSSAFSDSAVLPITRAAEFLGYETLRYLLNLTREGGRRMVFA
jgi:hypothetical protein